MIHVQQNPDHIAFVELDAVEVFIGVVLERAIAYKDLTAPTLLTLPPHFPRHTNK